MSKVFIVMGGLFGAAGVSAGAIGAHALKHQLSADMLAIYDSATEYLILHALALLATGTLLRVYASSMLLRVVGCLYIAGIIMFCGSLLLLSVTGYRLLPLVAPTGGCALIAAWLLLAAAAFVAE